MANYFNGELLHPKQDGNELERKYYNDLKALDKIYEENGGEITLMRHVEQVWDKDHQSMKPAVPHDFPKEYPLYLDTLGAVSVRYSNYPPTRNDKKLVWPTTKLWVEERLTLTREQKDLAWYLIFVTKFVKSEKNPNANLWVYDPQAEIKAEASKAKRIFSIDRILLDEQSPLYSESSMQAMADRFDIDIKGMKLDIASYAIYKAIKDGDEKNNPEINVDKFTEFANMLISKKKKNSAKADKKSDSGEKDKDVDALSNDDEDIVYTPDYLNSLEQKDLNEVSKKFGTKYPPHANRLDQTAQILEKVAVEQ